MRVCILGAGALGSILAAHLVKAGHDVTIIARGSRARFLREEGMHIQGLSQFSTPVSVVEQADTIDHCDVFVLSTKTYDTQAALEGVRHLRPGMALSVQNGVLKNDQLATVFGPASTVGCIADFSGELTEAGIVMFTRNEGLHVGELVDGPSDRVNAFVNLLNDAGIKAAASHTIQSLEWSKYAAWMALTAISLLTRLHTHRIYQDPQLSLVHQAILRESAALATAVGVELVDLGGLLQPRSFAESAPSEASALMKKLGDGMEENGIVNHRMSALQDLLRGRRLELEETFGHATRKASELGVAIPTLDVCYRLLKGLDPGSV